MRKRWKFRIVMNSEGRFKPQEKEPWSICFPEIKIWETVGYPHSIKGRGENAYGWYSTIEECEEIIKQRMGHLAKCEDGILVPGTEVELGML